MNSPARIARCAPDSAGTRRSASRPPPDHRRARPAPRPPRPTARSCRPRSTSWSRPRVACEAAGAAMIHVHIRDDEHRPTLDRAAAARTRSPRCARAPTWSSSSPPAARCTTRSTHRLKVLDAEPDSCSLTMGTTNFGDDVFLNPWPFVCDLYQLSQEREVVPEFELFDLGQVHALHAAARQVRPAVRRPGALRPGDGRPRRHARHRRRAGRRRPRLPAAVTSWSATGIGRSTLAVALASLSKGGHLRVGMEDVLTIAAGVPVESNRQLVERAVELGRLAQRTPMTPPRPASCSASGRDSAAAISTPSQRSSAPRPPTPVSRRAPGRRRRGPPRRRRPRPRSRTPGRTSSAVIERRAAHWEQTVTCPPATHGGEQVGQRRGERQRERLGPPGHREPRGLAGQPQRRRRRPSDRGGRDRERLVAALGVLGAAGHLDHAVERAMPQP